MTLRPGRLDHAIGAVLALLQVLLLAATSSQVGIPRDESFYFHAAEQIAGWVDRLDEPGVASFSRAEIDRGFSYNHEHPVLMKTLFGVSKHWLHDKWQVISDPILAWRLPTMLLAGLAVWLAFLLGLALGGRTAGVIAALALALQPRVFFHAHLACFDAPVTAMWLLICYTFLRAMRSRRWAVAAGVATGLGLATKLNIFFLPFVLLGIAVIDAWQWRRRTGAWRAPAGERGPLTYHVWTGASMIVLGAGVFFLHWPWLWHDTAKRLGFYIGFHAKHVHYPVDYLGHLYFRPPFPVHFPVVNTLLTVPVPVLLLGGVGLVLLARQAWRAFRAREAPGVPLVVLANFAAPIAIIALPFTPIFGGTKHWMPAMPFLAVAAGVGAVHVGRALFARWPARQALATAALGVAMMLPAGWATLTYGAHGPSYYNALAGGPAGAADLRMARDFWGYGSVAVLPYLDAHVEERGLTFWHDATGWAVQRYQQAGLLRPDIRVTGDWAIPFSDWAIYHDYRDKLPEELDIWRDYGTEWPVDGHFVDGVQTVGIYHRPAPRAAPPVPPGGR
ncbi:MAG: glycosyltransferase family 39 protein [Myxococcales bacterium]|nr:glycosyltransferase family 39 protein [Myxococcales bacterium]MCB9548136.1 glycosyltransferase family 39 protein [Myxococcales bacterium]